jgi:hypothetical protein
MFVINLKIVIFYVRSLEYETNAVCFCSVLVSYIRTRAYACIVFICMYNLSEDIYAYIGHTQPTLTAINEDHYSTSSATFNNTFTDTQNTLQPLDRLLIVCSIRVLTAVVVKSSVVWVITPCSSLNVYLLPASCLFFNRGIGGDIFLWNVGWLWTDCTALYPRR